MNGELISRSKCKRQASQQASKCLQTYIKHTESSEQAKQTNQNQSKDIGIQINERKLTQQTGRAELLENKKEIYHTLVFLPGPHIQLTFPNLLEEVTQSAQNEPAITDTGQSSYWLAGTSDDSISFLDELLAPDVPAQSAHLGELNTPMIGKLLMLVQRSLALKPSKNILTLIELMSQTNFC